MTVNGEAAGWLIGLSVDLNQLVEYGKGKYGYTDEQILQAVERAYLDRESIRVDQIGHEIWQRVDKAPNRTASIQNYSPPDFTSISRSVRAFVCLYAIWLVYTILKGTIL